MYLLVCDFSSIHHETLQDTISWECVVKDDCVRSCLIELQSFPLSKLCIDPVHRILVLFPLCLYNTRRGLVKPSSCGSLWFLCMGFTAVENTDCLSLLEFCPPVYSKQSFGIYALSCSVKDQWCCVLNDLEELGGKEFLVLTDQHSIEIFSCCHRLRPFCSSIHR